MPRGAEVLRSISRLRSRVFAAVHDRVTSAPVPETLIPRTCLRFSQRKKHGQFLPCRHESEGWNMTGVFEQELAEQLKLAGKINRVIRESLTDEVKTLRAVDVGQKAVYLPGGLRLLENLFLARRIHAAVARLMLRTADSSTDEDLTEPAAVLDRQLQELLFQVVWVAIAPPPQDVPFPADIGDADLIRNATQSNWDDDTFFEATVSYLTHSTTWTDVQALRSELYDIDQQRKLEQDMIKWNVTDANRHESNLEILQDRDAMIVARLEEIGAPTTKREDYVSIAKKHMGTGVAVAYRIGSDTAHAGQIARLHQRGPEDDQGLGAPSSAERRASVMASANASLLEIGGKVLVTLGGDPAQMNRVAKAMNDRLQAL